MQKFIEQMDSMSKQMAKVLQEVFQANAKEQQDAEAPQALDLVQPKLAALGESSIPAPVPAACVEVVEAMDLDEEAIDAWADLFTGVQLQGDGGKRRVRLEASKARIKAERRDQAFQLGGVRKRVNK